MAQFLNYLDIKRSITLLLCLLLAACATTDPYTGEEEATKSTSGAIIGAFAGALLGAATSSKNDRKRAMLKGAGIGAVAGGSVGYYMDQQEKKLRAQLQGTGVSVTRQGNTIVLNMPSNITFDTDSAELKPQFHKTMDSVVLVLNEFKSTLITAMGHTDSTGADEYNQQLSEKRALSVSNYLISKGVASQRLAAIGYGETQPAATNATPEGRALNRRVELKLDPVSNE